MGAEAPKFSIMKLKLVHFLIILAALSIWFALITQIEPIPLLLAAPFFVLLGTMTYLSRSPFIIRASIGFLTTNLFQFFSAFAIVTIPLLGGPRGYWAPAAFTPEAFSFIIGFTIWSVMVTGMAIYWWHFFRAFRPED